MGIYNPDNADKETIRKHWNKNKIALAIGVGILIAGAIYFSYIGYYFAR